MMRKHAMNTKFNILIIVAILFSTTAFAEKVSRSMQIAGATNNTQKLIINNLFGDIIIEEAKSDSIIVNIELSVTGSLPKATDMLKEMDVDIKESNNELSFKTKLPKNQKTLKPNVTYRIEMPLNIELNIENSYGDVYIDEFKGQAEINIKYGDLLANNWNNAKTSKIAIDYGDVKMKTVNKLELNIIYGNLFISEEAKELTIKSSYSDLHIEKVDKLNATSTYDEAEIKNISQLNLKGTYSDFSIGKLNNSLQTSLTYGKLKIFEVNENIKTIECKLTYSDFYVDMGETHYKLKTSGNYSKVRFLGSPDKFISSGNFKDSSANKEGYVGSSNANCKITISSTYSKVELSE